jgi:5-methylcytosine-specific restriction protein B
MAYTPNENLTKLRDYLLSGANDTYEDAVDSPLYHEFLAAFPASGLKKLTMDQYCLGTRNNDSFSWWIERGLFPVLGRYSPGTSKGHLLYYQDEHKKLYKHRYLLELSNQEALQAVLNVVSVLANAKLPQDQTWLDDDKEIMQRAGLDLPYFGGVSRKIRILACYHPDQLLLINSTKHIDYFLKIFGFSDQEMPAKNKPVARLLLLDQVYQYLKQELPDLTRRTLMYALYEPEAGLWPPEDGEIIDPDPDEEDSLMLSPPSLNTILYGPPGTGKTYATINEALAILDPEFLAENSERPLLKARFDERVQSGDIRFVTFHQSFSYEDFVEGLRPENGEDGQLRYEVADGVFKQICTTAAARITQGAESTIDLTGRTIWKMSLGNSKGNDSYIYAECIENSEVLLGYGDNRDFQLCQDRNDVWARFKEKSDASIARLDYPVTAMTFFVTRMKPGDLVIVSEGLTKFRAIGEVSGDYHCLQREDGYCQARKVKWLRVYSVALPHDQLMLRQFSQQTLYELRPEAIDRDKLDALLNSKTETFNQQPGPKVLIIDEINRGNVSRIFGELITLIEPSKRAGAEEALQVVLPYSKQPFSVPDNLYLIGTMNTADRSLAGLDIALRRRFSFKEMPPQYAALDQLSLEGINLGQLLRSLNDRIEVLLDRDHCLGHAYFMRLKEGDTIAQLAPIFRQQILPLLQEYFFEDWGRIRWVLNDHRKSNPQHCFVTRQEINSEKLFGPDVSIGPQHATYTINAAAFDSPQAYLGVIDHQMAATE